MLAPWYRVVGDGERLLLEHGQTVVVLEGAAVRALLPSLLPLLDGTRTIDQLVDRLGPAVRPAVEHALATLASHDLLAEGPDAAPEVRSAAYAMASLAGVAPSVAAARLEAASVEIVGAAPAGEGIARLLRASRVGKLSKLRWRRRPSADLVLVAPAADEVDALERWNEAALACGVPWLLLRPFDGRLASVGPLVLPGESCCYLCVLLRRAANVEYGDDLRDLEAAPIAAVGDAAFESLAVSLAAHLALRWLVGRDKTLPGTLHTVELRPWPAIVRHEVLRVPRCPACSHVADVAPPLPWHPAEAA